MDQTITMILFLAAVLVFGSILFAVVSLTKRGPSRLDIDKYRSRWMTIEGKLNRDEVSSYSMSILNADTLLDQAMKEKGIPGQVMADRMKQMQKKWTDANAVWTAHKLRNQIAHESDVRLDYDRARRTLRVFKQALKDVGAI